MRVNIAQTTRPWLSPPSLHNASSSSSSTSSSSTPTNRLHLHRSRSSIFGSSLKVSPAKSTAQNLRRSCSASFDDHDFVYPIEDFTQKQKTHHKKIQKPVNVTPTTTSFGNLNHEMDVLEPSFLGIRPGPPDWPARDELIRDCIARRANCVELPLSLRMIKLKHRLKKLEDEREIREDLDVSDSFSKLCYSALSIIKEAQSQALRIKGLVLDEDLDGIVSKVQKEMTSSFLWLFREVYAKTPDLMVEVMMLSSNFASYSLDDAYKLPEKQQEHEEQQQEEEEEIYGVPIFDENEEKLWYSMVEEAHKMKGHYGNLVIDEEGLGFGVNGGLMNEKFIGPEVLRIEDDYYEEYNNTDIMYQIGLSSNPNDTLLLTNYAQFLCLVSRDYDRAEECFKRAIQSDPTDAEALSQYAIFLWVVRKDVWEAEERFQQALAAEPHNTYHASNYASFLWNTGGEDTCYPLDPPCGST